MRDRVRLKGRLKNYLTFEIYLGILLILVNVGMIFVDRMAAALLAVAGLAFTGATGRKRRVGAVLMGAGGAVLVTFAVLGAWAAVNFNSFFAAFHGLLFSQGNWQFPFDSLLICSLPTPFWMGMGVICLVVSVVLSLISLLVGRKCRN